MASPQAHASLNSRTGVGAKTEALSKLEDLHDEAAAEVARRSSNKVLRRAVQAWRRGDITGAGQLALEATTVDETNPKPYHVLGMALERMGWLHKALVVYEHAYQLDPNDSELLINLGMIAWRLEQKEGAAKMFALYTEAKPNSPLGFNNLGSLLSDMGNADAAIETLRTALNRMPTEAILWNSLATVLAEQGRVSESIVFYQEAIRLDPDFARLYHNLGFAYSHLGMLDEALAAYDTSLSKVLDPNERLESIHSRAICLLGMGRLEEGFVKFEIRNNPRFRDYMQHDTKAPQWDGEDLSGKRILVVAEQGLGDEFMFANTLPDLQRAVGDGGKLQIAVDSRLVKLFQRSFPKAEVGSYEDRTITTKDGQNTIRFTDFATQNGEPDYWITMGTAAAQFRKSVSNFRRKAFLAPDLQRVAQFRETLRSIGSGPYVGICWRSLKLGPKRARLYSKLEHWEPILKTQGVTFINLQCGDCNTELAEIKEKFGIEIHSLDLDLKDDVDGTAALCSALDLVISAPTASAANAGAVGAEVWFVMAGRTWPQLGTDEIPWYRKTRVFSPENFADWNALMPRIGDALSDFVKQRKG